MDLNNKTYKMKLTAKEYLYDHTDFLEMESSREITEEDFIGYMEDYHKAKVNEITDEDIYERFRIQSDDGSHITAKKKNLATGARWFKEQLLK